MSYINKDILDNLRKGNDNSVLTYLYKEVFPKVKHYIKTNKGNEDEAKDIFQDAVLIFYKKVKTNTITEPLNVTAYICMISKNLWINRAKKMNRTTEIQDEDFRDAEEDLLSNIITEEKRTALSGLLSQVGEECQKLMKYVVYDNRSMREIAELMGYSSENVAKTYHYRCKQKFVQLVMKNKEMIDLLKQ
jgi:RNA polymerase sigma factor (sigma-70 family)